MRFSRDFHVLTTCHVDLFLTVTSSKGKIRRQLIPKKKQFICIFAHKLLFLSLHKANEFSSTGNFK